MTMMMPATMIATTKMIMIKIKRIIVVTMMMTLAMTTHHTRKHLHAAKTRLLKANSPRSRMLLQSLEVTLPNSSSSQAMESEEEVVEEDEATETEETEETEDTEEIETATEVITEEIAIEIEVMVVEEDVTSLTSSFLATRVSFS